MKLVAERYSLSIVPENPMEEAFLEDVLGAYSSRMLTVVNRVNVLGTQTLAYLEIKKAHGSVKS